MELQISRGLELPSSTREEILALTLLRSGGFEFYSPS